MLCALGECYRYLNATTILVNKERNRERKEKDGYEYMTVPSCCLLFYLCFDIDVDIECLGLVTGDSFE